MKKMIIGLVIIALFIIVPLLTLLVTRSIVCQPNENVYSVSLPLAKAVVTHIETYGIPERLEDIEQSSYTLIPCSKKTKDFICRDYFFEHKGKFYTTELSKLPAGDGEIWIRLRVEHNYTVNYYPIALDRKVSEDALIPRVWREPVGICHQMRQ